MSDIQQKELFVEMRKAHEEFKTTVNKELDEVRTNGTAHPDTVSKIDKINEDLTLLNKRLDDAAAAEKRASVNENGVSQESLDKLEVEKRSFNRFLRVGSSNMTSDEVRALSSSSDADGGFLIPTTFESDIIMAASNESEMRALCNVAPTGRDSVQLSALSKPVVAWGTRNLAVTPQELEAGGERIDIFDLRALTLISNNTLDDAVADVWGEIRAEFGLAVAEAEDDAIISAAGNQSPQGILADSRVLANVMNTGVAGALSDGSNNGADALIDMLQALKKTYRRNATWMMNSKTEGAVRKLKNGNGDYLWQPSIQVGLPNLLLGRAVVNPESMADVVANSYSIALGDVKRGYKLRDRAGLSVKRLDEKYAEFDQTGFLIKKRLGGQVVLPEAFQVLKTSA